MDITTMSSREARARWRALLDAAYSGSADIVIERSGRKRSMRPGSAILPGPRPGKRSGPSCATSDAPRPRFVESVPSCVGGG
jgi:hypothetical protein